MNQVILGNSKEKLKELADNSVDSVVTDPPYEIGFMGKKWDSTGIAYDVELWKEVYRVLKPGGHLLSFGGTRTYHRMACAIEDAGFEIRDQIQWVYASGFPKSQNISKMIDKMSPIEDRLLEFSSLLKKKRKEMGLTVAQADKLITGGTTMYSFLEGRNLNGTFTAYRPSKEYYEKIVEVFGIVGYEKLIENSLETVGESTGSFGYQKDNERWVNTTTVVKSTTPEAQQWDGWGTALKPANEPIVLARKPFKGTVANNVLQWGVGGLNIGGCRVELNGDYKAKPNGRPSLTGLGDNYNPSEANQADTIGRWPANFIHDGSGEVLELFPQAKAGSSNGDAKSGVSGDITPMRRGTLTPRNDSGSAARFFYCAKTSKKERTSEGQIENKHPTVKPIALISYLCRLVTPPGGTVLDPFAGSGTTAIACMREGFNYILIELEEASYNTCLDRINAEQ